MSFLEVLIFIARGRARKIPDDAATFEAFFRALVGQDNCARKLAAALEKGIALEWEDVYDFVNPFGDRRGGAFNSVWTFDLDKDVLFLLKEDRFCSAPLELARQRLLTLDDFVPVSSPTKPSLEEQTLPGPYWEPRLDISPRTRSFSGRLLLDFVYTWRHVFRKQMNNKTFTKLAYAIIWISTLDFTIMERVGFEHMSGRGGPYAPVFGLPRWETPDATLVEAGSCWFAISQDNREGLEIVRQHWNSNMPGGSTAHLRTYVILTPRHVIICKVHEGEIVWTRPEALHNNALASDTAIDLILWAAKWSRTEPQLSAINRLPVEIQDRILHHAATSSVASAKLGCELGLGSPFSWVDDGGKIRVEESKRNRAETSPVESQIAFNGVTSGLSYKRERRYEVIHLHNTRFRTPGQI